MKTKNTTKTTTLATTALLLAAASASAQSYVTSAAPPASPGFFNEWLRSQSPNNNAWDIGVGVRLRYEIKDKMVVANSSLASNGGSLDFRDHGSVGSVENAYFLNRIKPHVGYTAEWFSAFVEGRGSGTSGDARNPNPESDGVMDFHQAYVALGNMKEFPLTVKVGRQELSYGDERLIGAFDWNNNGRVFDAAKLRWQNSLFGVDFFTSRVVLPNENHFNVDNDYDYFSGAYFNSATLVPKTDAQWYVLARNTSADSLKEKTSTTPAGSASARDIYTVGLRLKSKPADWGNWDYLTELMGQFGHYNDPATTNPTGKSLEHQAYAAVVSGGYTWSEQAWKPRLGVEFDYASGDDNAADGSHGTFENLFPTNHKFYGIMDFVSLQNIQIARLTSSIKPLPRLTLTGDYRAYWLADTHDNFYTVAGARRGGVGATPAGGYGINPTYGSFVGSEVDVTATYAITGWSTIQAGYGHFFVGDYIKQSLSAATFGSTDANFFYTQLSFNF